VKWAELVLVKTAMKFRIKTGPRIALPGERHLDSLEGHFSTKQLSYIEQTQKAKKRYSFPCLRHKGV
jgi:hypothetical protein